MKTSQLIPYESRAIAKNKDAQVKGIDNILKTYAEVETDTAQMKTVSIKAANGCRKLGIELQTLCGHEQVSFEFWQKNCGKLAKRFDFENAKIFITIARKMDKPAKTIADAAPFTQLIYQAVDLLQLPERTEAGMHSGSGPVQKFFAEIAIIKKDFDKAVRQLPLDKWPLTAKREFVKDSKWLRDAAATVEAFIKEEEK